MAAMIGVKFDRVRQMPGRDFRLKSARKLLVLRALFPLSLCCSVYTEAEELARTLLNFSFPNPP